MRPSHPNPLTQSRHNMRKHFLEIETRAGNPIQSGQFNIVPFAQVMHISLPILNDGLVWNRPISVLITGTDGQEELLPIRDYTRRIQWALWCTSLLGSALIWWMYRN